MQTTQTYLRYLAVWLQPEKNWIIRNRIFEVIVLFNVTVGYWNVNGMTQWLIVPAGILFCFYCVSQYQFMWVVGSTLGSMSSPTSSWQFRRLMFLTMKSIKSWGDKASFPGVRLQITRRIYIGTDTWYTCVVKMWRPQRPLNHWQLVCHSSSGRGKFPEFEVPASFFVIFRYHGPVLAGGI